MKHDLAEVVLTCRALSTQYGVNVVPTGAEAYTSLDEHGRPVIGVPFVPDMGDTEWILLRGYIDHECGHVKYSKLGREMEAALDAVVRDYLADPDVNAPSFGRNFVAKQLRPWVHVVWNILEDIRVEHLMGLDFPGCRFNFKRLALEVFDETSAGEAILYARYSTTDGAKLRDLLTVYLLYALRAEVEPALEGSRDVVLDVVTKEGDISFSSLDFARYSAAVDSFAAEYAKNPTDAFDATGKFMRIVKDVLDQYRDDAKKNRQQNDALGSAEQDGRQNGSSSDGYPYSEDTSSFLGAVTRDMMPSGETEMRVINNAETAGAALDNATSVPVRVKTAMDEAAKGHAPTYGSEIYDALQELQEFRAYSSLKDFDAGARHEPGVPRGSLSQETAYLGRNMEAAIAAVASSAGARLAAVLQTETYQRGRTGWSGRLDGRRLHRVGVADGRVFSRRAERIALQTEVIILYDASGSMQYCKNSSCGRFSASKRATSARSARFNPLEYAVVASYGLLAALRRIPHVRSSVWAFQDAACVPFAKFDSAELPRLYAPPSGGTPLGASVFRLLGEYTARPDWRRIMFVMSDGAPDSPMLFRSALTAAERSGVEVYGIGVHTYAMSAFFPDERRIELFDIKQLVPSMFAMMQRAMLKGVRHA